MGTRVSADAELQRKHQNKENNLKSHKSLHTFIVVSTLHYIHTKNQWIQYLCEFLWECTLVFHPLLTLVFSQQPLWHPINYNISIVKNELSAFCSEHFCVNCLAGAQMIMCYILSPVYSLFVKYIWQNTPYAQDQALRPKTKLRFYSAQ